MTNPRLVWCEASDRRLGELAQSGTPRSEWLAELGKITGGKVAKVRQIAARMHLLGIKLSESDRKAAMSNGGRREIMMNDARKAYVKDVYYKWMDIPAIMEEVNKMDGAKIKDVQSMVYCIQSCGFKRGPRPASQSQQEIRARHRAKMKEKFGVTQPNRAKYSSPQPKAIHAPIVISCPAAEPVERVPPSPELADLAVITRQERARAALMRRNADPMDVAKALGMPPHEVFRLYGDMRRQGARA